MRLPAAILFSLFVLTSCSQRSLKSLQKRNVRITGSVVMQSSSIINDTVKLQYLGCGGFYLQQNDQAIMIDPFFSHQSFMRIGRSILFGGKLKPMINQLDFGRRLVLDSMNVRKESLGGRVKGIFSAHGHYDHLMDVPFIYNEWLAQQPEIFVNSSSTTTLRHVIPSAKLNDIEKIAAVRNQEGDSIEFHSNGSIIRVYPIFADHNPHSRNIKLFAGSATKPPKDFDHHRDKTRVNDWLEGQTLSFLIDLVKNDQVYYRIFMQSSSCQFPNGIPPANLLENRKVDLAILGIASYHFSQNTYPCEFLNVLQPRNLVFVHWEDFFRKVHQRPKAVKTNDIPRFFNDIFSRCKMDYQMPLPGSVIRISR
ncbi:MAG TPA: hypothetical protein VGD65_04650 [Chryseosolibacter sp.]